MKILHYSLGFPPYRSGGLTKFCVDLMKEQLSSGHEVAMIWPGEISLISRNVSIKRSKQYAGIDSYEIINPLPVSYDEGIVDIDAFCKNIDSNVYLDFFCDYKPDVIHVHTLMGLHKSFLISAKKLNIRIVFTTHDFFPICPKVTLFYQGKPCKSFLSCQQCGSCNSTALSLKKIQILQSSIYRNIKDYDLIKKLRKHHRDNFLREDNKDFDVERVGCADDYNKLRNFYFEMISMMDIVHFNSSITSSVYSKVCELNNTVTIPITHGDIFDHRKKKEFSDSTLRIRYLGPMGEAKGYYVLIEALNKLWLERHDFVLDIHFTPSEIFPYMRIHSRFTYNELESIFDCSDILIAPSKLYETFGYTVLEALSYGVPVIISSNVGAKDILADGSGIILSEVNTEELYIVIKNLTSGKLKKMNEVILERQHITIMSELSQELITKCYFS